MSRFGRRALLAASVLPMPALASRSLPIVLVVGSRLGTTADLWARSAAPFLERHWRHAAVTVRNLPGRGGLAALEEVAATEVGQRQIAVFAAPLLLARAIEAGGASPLAGLRPLAAIQEEALVLVGRPDAPIDPARIADDGRPLATPAAGTAAHLAARRIAAPSGLAVLPFASAVAARQAAAAGHAVAALLPLADAAPALREGKLVALGVTGRTPNPLLPDVPTLAVPGGELLALPHRGFMLPSGAPESVAHRLLPGIASLASDPDFVKDRAAQGHAARFLPPDAWAMLLEQMDNELRDRWRDDPWIVRSG